MSKKTSSEKVSIHAVDLFCGVGGLTHGLIRGGVKVAAGIDVDGSCRYPYEANNAAVFLERDVNDLSAAELQKLFGKSPVTLLAGCAPCQPFSTYSRSARGKRSTSDDWGLVGRFGRLVRDVQPQLVTMENVPALEHHPIFTKFLSALKGYHVSWTVVECSTIGVPQTRKRLVLLGSKLGSEYLSLSCGQGQEATVRAAIGHLPQLNAGQCDEADPLHIACRLSALNLRRIRASRPGGTWRDWPSSLRAQCHKRATGDTYPSVYGRMSWDEPAPTITTQSFGYGNGRFGHPEQDRAITLREAAMLQTFPPAYAFIRPGEKVKFSRLGRLIGNAVPVRLGEVIAETLRRHVALYSPALGK